MKVAITGASGHIGNSLARTFLEKGVRVKVLVHNYLNDLGTLDVEQVKGSLADLQSLKELCSNVDVVYHLAAKISIDNRDKTEVFKTNVEGTRNIIEICQELKIRRLVYFGSIDALDIDLRSDVVDENCKLVSDGSMAYEQSKAEAEKLVIAAANQGLNTLVLSPTAVVGPYDFIPSYLGQALIKMYNNKLPMLIKGGYNWVDVRDIVEAAIAASEKGRSGEKYLLAGSWCSLKGLAAMTESISGKHTSKREVPLFLAKIGLPFIGIYSKITNASPLYTSNSLKLLVNSHRNISSEKALNELGYTPRPLIETLRDTYSWFKQNNYLR